MYLRLYVQLQLIDVRAYYLDNFIQFSVLLVELLSQSFRVVIAEIQLYIVFYLVYGSQSTIAIAKLLVLDLRIDYLLLKCHQYQALRLVEMLESVLSTQSRHLLIRVCDEPESFLLFRLEVIVFQRDRQFEQAKFYSDAPSLSTFGPSNIKKVVNSFYILVEFCHSLSILRLDLEVWFRFSYAIKSGVLSIDYGEERYLRGLGDMIIGGELD